MDLNHRPRAYESYNEELIEAKEAPSCVSGDGESAHETPTDGVHTKTPCLNSEPSKVDEALATALLEASKAGQWEALAMLVKELEARRTAKDKP